MNLEEQQPESAPGRTRERILVLFSNPANLSLLRAMLTDRYDVLTSLDEADARDATGPFDLCIVDTISLKTHRSTLLRLRLQFAPLLLPCLVLADRRDPGLLIGGLWDVADDILLRPVERLELALRVQALARLRALSVKLDAVSDRYEYERRIAQRLQEASLPHSVDIAGLEFSGVYRPGSAESNVGGDWYDALKLPDGRVVLTIGDVTGSGLDAAVTMTSVKHAIRGIAYLHSDPALILDAADRALHATEPGRIVTAFIGVYDPVSAELRFATAGHPSPFVRRASGTVEQLMTSGTPLGIPWRVAHETQKCRLQDGDVLFLFTDGLLESERDAIEAEGRLEATLCDAKLATERDVAAFVYERMVRNAGVDDVAAAAIRIVEQTSLIHRWLLHSDDRDAVRAARNALTELLAQQLRSVAAVGVAELIIAELIGNVVRHAPGEFELAIDLGAPEPVVHVLDNGRGFHHTPKLPTETLAEHGRGVFIVTTLSPGFTIERRLGGGSHARAILPADTGVSGRPGGRFINVDGPFEA